VDEGDRYGNGTFWGGLSMKKEKPIIFSTPMVKAIQNTKPGVWPPEPIDPKKEFKSMTRRIITPQPIKIIGEGRREHYQWRDGIFSLRFYPENSSILKHMKYQIGDILYVREGGWECPERTPKMMRDGADTWEKFYYNADIEIGEKENLKDWGFKRRTARYMPKWAARIELEVKKVRIEEVQNITPENVLDEGIYIEPPSGADPKCPENWDKMTEKQKILYLEKISRPTYMAQLHYANELISAYSKLWDKINAKRFPWSMNPWVIVVEFMRVK
jgi:hypothetical protein